MSKETAEYEIKLKDAFSSPLAGLEKQMNSFESKLNGINKLAAGFGLAFGITEGIQAVTALASKIVSLGANMEQTKISFETMLGSADRADKVLKQLVKFAEITPFRQDEVIQGSKQLLAYGFAAENLTTDLRKLGDVSAGLNIPLGDLIYLYGTIRTQGKAMTKDLMQFANRGIPIYTELAKVTGKSGAAIQEMVEDGKIGFDVIEKAFNNMTKQGSMFGGLMEKLSKSLGGRWSTFLDKLEVMGTTMGTKLIPGLGDMLDRMTGVVDIIPRLDFTPITFSVQQLITEVSILKGTFDDLFGVVGAKMTTFDALSYALRYIAYLFRVAWTPIRLVVHAFTQFITLVTGSLGILQGLGNIIEGLASRNMPRLNKGIQQVHDSWNKFIKDQANQGEAFFKKEKEGWAKIFSDVKNIPGISSGYNPFGGMYDSIMNGAAGSGSSQSSSAADKSKSAGVEKIQSGTRNITVNINKLIETVKFETTNGQSQAQLMDMIRRTLVTAVNDVNIVAQ